MILYWVLIVRDLSCLLTLLVNQYRASSQLYFTRLLDGGVDNKDTTRVALQDFEMLL